MMRLSLPLLLLLVCQKTAFAAELTCYEEAGTLRNSCYSTKQIRMNGSLRASPLFIGGPNAIRQTPYSIVVDCARNVTTLQDADGINFGGGRSSAAPGSRDLAKWMCAEPNPKIDKNIRQF